MTIDLQRCPWCGSWFDRLQRRIRWTGRAEFVHICPDCDERRSS